MAVMNRDAHSVRHRRVAHKRELKPSAGVSFGPKSLMEVNRIAADLVGAEPASCPLASNSELSSTPILAGPVTHLDVAQITLARDMKIMWLGCPAGSRTDHDISNDVADMGRNSRLPSGCGRLCGSIEERLKRHLIR